MPLPAQHPRWEGHRNEGHQLVLTDPWLLASVSAVASELMSPGAFGVNGAPYLRVPRSRQFLHHVGLAPNEQPGHCSW